MAAVSKPPQHKDNPVIPRTPDSESPSKPSGAPSPSIQVTLPDERYGEAVFTFKIPAREHLMASANRLLRFELPANRDHLVYERLIKTCVISTGFSKKTLETLPLPRLEKIYREIWKGCFARGAFAPLNGLLTLFMVLEESSEFRISEMVHEDIQQMGLRDAEPMHSYYYQGTLGRDDMMTFLAGQGYRADFLAQERHWREREIELAYLACRRLSDPLPWLELLQSASRTELESLPRLNRLYKVSKLLESLPDLPKTITPQNLFDVSGQLRRLLHDKTMGRIAEESGITRPVRELVIVEGETEKMLLPLFAKARNIHLHALGIEVLPAGGKNHVSALYRKFARQLDIPICIVLDRDAADIAGELRQTLREGDCIYEIQEGEFEDLYDLKLILRVINQEYQPYPEVTSKRFSELTGAGAGTVQGRVQALKLIWQSYGLGSFDKIEFAGKYAERFNPETDQPPAAILPLLETIERVRGNV